MFFLNILNLKKTLLICVVFVLGFLNIFACPFRSVAQLARAPVSKTGG